MLFRHPPVWDGFLFHFQGDPRPCRPSSQTPSRSPVTASLSGWAGAGARGGGMAEPPGGILKAVKFVHGDLDGLAADAGAAEQEYKSLHRVKAIRHPFILSIERFDVLDGQLVIVMELADQSLQDRYQECAANGLP